MTHRCALVVDAVPAARRRAVTLLRLAGFRVHEASGVVEAVALAARHEPALVVTEPDLPDGDGLQMLAELRRSGSSAQFLVVAAALPLRVRKRAVEVGASGCLHKPLEPADLVDFLRGRTTGPAAQDAPRRETADWVLQQHALRVTSERADRGTPRGPLRAARLRETYAIPLPHRASPLGGDHLRRAGLHDRRA